MTARAAGKIILFGEYAVLRGHPCLVAAIDRYATCTVEPGGPLLVEGVGHGRYRLGGDRSALPLAAAIVDASGITQGHYRLETDAFRTAEGKLGLGSSAASSVALLRALRPDLNAQQVFEKVFAAQQAVIGRGSGADLAASATGGMIRYTQGAWAHVKPPLLNILTAWTGQAAHTPTFIRAIEAYEARAPADFKARLRDIAQLTDAPISVASVRRAGDAVRALGEAAQVPIWTEAHTTLDTLAQEMGGACKPLGAGGGDLAWLYISDPSAEAELIAQAEAAGFSTYRFQIANVSH